ncbi:MAG: transcription elongation factor GreA [Calditrichota bacterium]
MDSVYLTHDGLKKLQGDLNRLANELRPRATQALADARAKGDLSENAEYDAAREELSSIDRQISELQTKMSNVHIIDESAISRDEVRILSEVTVLNLVSNKDMRFILVDPLQADPRNNLISVKSPIAQGLLGKRVGDEASISVPSGELRVRIVSIERSQGL